MPAIPTLRHALIAACVTALPGCSWLWEAEPVEDDPQTLALRQTILETALGQLGRPYRYGGGDGDGFDCSGLVQHVYADAGISVPRTAAEQARAGRRIPLRDAAPGDLVLFRIRGGMHVTIYVGEGRVVHAPAAGKDVTLAEIGKPYWRERFHSAVRVVP